jgi:antagonist of KipI
MTRPEALEVIQPGFLSTVQDKGRHGYQQYGVPVSGAMDGYALLAANLLLGNDEGDACLEMTVVGPWLRCLSDTAVAVTGADLSPYLNGSPLPMWEAVIVRWGDIVSFGHPRCGCRGYLAIAGGIDVPRVMGSRSTYVKSGLGGVGGRPLRPGDRLHSGQAWPDVPLRKLPREFIPVYQAENNLRVVLGPQEDHFTGRGIRTFLNSQYTISVQADRMGYRLEGPPIEHKAGADIVSDGIPAGAVQVPGNGVPIILLADRQTIGGYVKIATVSTADLPRLAQARPGEKLRFSEITEEEAYKVVSEYERNIDSVRAWIHGQQN